ncbi:DUF6350 family protein [Streptomyces sp. NPDC051320]|uniref:cell division protein PerM n=1 Tax=Streptomyces sp. NPDC051320 TaxID=3154644 RepID=UPI003416A655
MTQTTEYRPLLPPLRSRPTALAHCVLRGAVAAGLGFSSLAVLVMLLWISSPYPDSGPRGALHVTAGLWLLAHGTALTRQSTLSGAPAPLGVAPMLLMLLPMWLIYRAARDALDPEERRPVATDRGAFTAVTGGYLLVTAAVLAYAAGGPMPAAPVSALLHLPAAIGGAAGIGVWKANGCPGGPFPRWLCVVVPAGVRNSLGRPWAAAALRSAGAATAVLVGGGALLVGGSLVWHEGAARASLMQLTGVWSGRFAVLLLAVALVPNAAVWAASYALGPGFALGVGATATPLATVGNPALPYFPLLAALPTEGRGTPLTWAVAAVPVAAGVVLGWFATRVGPRGRRRALRDTVRTAAVAALGCAIAMAVLAGLAGGPLGTGALRSFGPVWWRTGAAALAWTLTAGMPVALVRHWWAGHPERAARKAAATAAKNAEAARAAKAAQAAQAVHAAKTAERERAARPERRGWWRRTAPAGPDTKVPTGGAPGGAGSRPEDAHARAAEAVAEVLSAVQALEDALPAAPASPVLAPHTEPPEQALTSEPAAQESTGAKASTASKETGSTSRGSGAGVASGDGSAEEGGDRPPAETNVTDTGTTDAEPPAAESQAAERPDSERPDSEPPDSDPPDATAQQPSDRD